jgi:hypothetical protein
MLVLQQSWGRRKISLVHIKFWSKDCVVHSHIDLKKGIKDIDVIRIEIALAERLKLLYHFIRPRGWGGSSTIPKARAEPLRRVVIDAE